MRKTLSILAAGLVVAGLAACSSGSPSSTSTPSASAASSSCINVKEGDASKAVTVSGAFGAAPKVTIKTPLKASQLERSVAITGDGSKLKSGDSVDIAIAAYNGTTGKELIPATGFGGSGAQTIPVDATKYAPGLVRAVECLPLKSRVVMTGSAKEMFGAADISQLPIKAADPVVFVVDSIDEVATRADGIPVAPKAGLPTVKLSTTGEPSISIPKTDPPKTTEIADLKQGAGEVVQSGDTVTVHYKGVLWRNGQMFDSSWSRGAPTSFQTTDVVKGFQAAIEGQKVGSQVIAVVPPADGYGSTGKGEIKATDTMVFVIDILKTTR